MEFYLEAARVTSTRAACATYYSLLPAATTMSVVH